MYRLKRVLREGLIIVLTGVILAIAITSIWTNMRPRTIDDFKREYKSSTQQQQVAVADRYLKLFPVQDLAKAVEEQNADGVCHSQAHSLGRAVFKKNPNFTEAIRQCGSSCTYGCFHGVLMQMFATDSDTLGGVIEDQSPEEYLAHVKSVAKNLCTSPEVKSVVRLRYCYHGLGHVFGYLGGTDIQKSMSSCDIFNDSKYVATSCRSGVFMEYLFSTSSAKLLYSKGPGICDTFPDYTSSCYRYKAYGWISVWGGIKPAIQACDSFGKNMLLCISNTAEAASSLKLVSTKEGVQSMCGDLTGEKRIACISGALKKVIDLNDGDDSEHACDVVAPEYRDGCLRVRDFYKGDIYLTLDGGI